MTALALVAVVVLVLLNGFFVAAEFALVRVRRSRIEELVEETGNRRARLTLTLLDDMSRYLASFKRKAKGTPTLWGLHNYGDVNRRRTNFTKVMLRTVPGEVWLTETGGIVQLLPSFTRSPSRAARDLVMVSLHIRTAK